ncbi:MAG TPA: AI-2E family transporter [Steroidobacteraceae bacterium]|nr:AI-2E family transporter [Steroidobacteraceae bacterium]
MVYSAFYRRSFLLATAAVLAWLLLEVLAPLEGALGWAVVLAFLLYPLHERLSRRLKGRDMLSAGIITGLTPFLVLAPLSVLGVVFAGQVANLVGYLRGRTFLGYPQLLSRLEGYPLLGDALRWSSANFPVSAAQIQEWVTGEMQALLKSAAAAGGSLALGVFGTVVGFFMMLFLLFFLLRDGRAILEHLTRLIPLEAGRRERLLEYLAQVTRAVVFGSTATALIQGIFVAVGFALAGLPSPVVFGVVATIAALLPAGAAVVLAPAVLYLAVGGHWLAALFLALWSGLLAVVENVARPLLTAHRAHVSTLAVFVGAVGGVSAFGVLGLIIGPVLLSFVVALVRFTTEVRGARIP